MSNGGYDGGDRLRLAIVYPDLLGATVALIDESNMPKRHRFRAPVLSAFLRKYHLAPHVLVAPHLLHNISARIGFTGAKYKL